MPCSLVMENGPLPLGLEDGTIDVERLLVEPQDGHVSMDSVICFNEKNPENAMDMEDVSRSFGGSGTGITHEREDILNGEVLDAMPGEVEVGYFRLHNDFCSMREEYLLGVEFAESITNLDYGSTEGLQASDPNSQMQESSAGSDTACNSKIFRIMEAADRQNDQYKFGSPELSNAPSFHDETLDKEKPSSGTSQNIGKSHNSSSGSFQDVLSDENDGELSPSGEMFCCPKTEKNNGFDLIGQDGEMKIFHGQETLTTMSVQASSTNGLPTQKRSRKPTQRYIDELTDPISTYSKKRREVSSSTVKNKSLGNKGHKKCHMGSKAVALPAEESSVKAIQVPFGSLVEGHAYDLGEKKRNMAWRPLPKSILRRVCELNATYPYPKGQRTKIAHLNHDSPDKSTDITLSDYRRILRSINGD
ncbi:hypothetical protein CDL12_03893 [Handroanthus impetiginosus]|uniref:Uncharacterized protein n=1 Tax=Handroanthus impetiginosus TaxID=429701 RepID=A0A2G9I0U1_9LAMI|nr:hypothetical protein CDL12_03893 [Handroanthus impetiginosus]